jgi:hypothetical protein
VKFDSQIELNKPPRCVTVIYGELFHLHKKTLKNKNVMTSMQVEEFIIWGQQMHAFFHMISYCIVMQNWVGAFTPFLHNATLHHYFSTPWLGDEQNHYTSNKILDVSSLLTYLDVDRLGIQNKRP